MLKNIFTAPTHVPHQHPVNPVILMLYNTIPYLNTLPFSHNVSPNPPNTNVLVNLHKINDILIFVLSQGQGCCRLKFCDPQGEGHCKNLIFMNPKVKTIWEFLLSRSRTKTSLKTP